MDRDGYPEEDEIQRICHWDWKDPVGLAEFVGSLWYYPEFWKRYGRVHRRKIEAHTGGWSGNEDIIGALQENAMWWMCCWVSSKRGGHYEFELPAWAFSAPTDSTGEE